MSLIDELARRMVRTSAQRLEEREKIASFIRAKNARFTAAAPPVPPPPPKPVFKPAQASPFVPVVVAPPPPELPPQLPAGPGVWRRQCQARNGDTGRQCGLLENHPQRHRDARGEFGTVALPGQTHFIERQKLDDAALRCTGANSEFGKASLGRGDSRTARSEAQLKRRNREANTPPPRGEP